MGSPRSRGYQAVFSGLRTRSSQAASDVDFLYELRSSLRGTLLREGNPLGNDQYGAELQKNRDRIELAVMDAFSAYIHKVERLSGGLWDNARNYEDAEDYGYGDGYGAGDDGYWYSEGTGTRPDTSLNDLSSGSGDPAFP
ncbi:hypothetical protein [Nonomuraea sp. NPDC050783]|uniref:hypothetical protein n=1 Tax=Nonomuraea sp. NPDC050783 TaxID=3154634 RepID=UPI003466D6E6